VHFADTAKDPIAVAQRIYDFIGWSFTAEARSAIEAWLAENVRENRPPHDYTLEMFGYTEEGLKEKYRAYRERFILDA